MVTLVVFGSVSHISLPLVVETFESVYFVLSFTSVQGVIIYGFIVGTRSLYKSESNILFVLWSKFQTHWKIIIATGISNTFMSLFMAYSANPIRTPVVIQSVFLGLAILFSIGFSKVCISKEVEYNWPYVIISMALLFGSVGISIVPLVNLESNSEFNIGWIFMYLGGISMYSLTNVLQEKYIRDSEDDNLDNKFHLAFVSSLFQFYSMLSLVWLDVYIGYTSNAELAYLNFKSSLNLLGSDPKAFILFEVFVILWYLLFVIALFLNEISTNYTMILTNITNQSVALFFIMFPHLNNGISYPIYITLSSLGTSFLSVVFWIKAEKVNQTEEQIISNSDIEERISLLGSKSLGN